MFLFLIIAIGYLIGRIRIKGISLGMSAILIVALFFGHYGFSVPGLIKNLGLACFATAVGYITGPVFLKNFKNKALYYVFLGFIIIFISALLCIASVKIFHLPSALGLGLFSGAVTSTPGLAMALELTGDSLVSVGYGIAYPFGVVGLVLTVQILSKFREKPEIKETVSQSTVQQAELNNLISIDKNGMFFYSIALVIGIAIGSQSLKLSDGTTFGLGISGGTLLSGLFFGSLSHIGPLSTKASKGLLDTMREFGLALFLAAAGLEAGSGFVSTIKEYGFVLFFIGLFMTLFPSIFTFLLANKVLHLDVRSSLGAICGGMTSTPALGSLSDIEEYEKVTTGYAATYAVALLSIILMIQMINFLLN